MLCWLGVGALILNRLFFHGTPPPALVPTLAIELVPPAVAGIAYFALTGGRIDLLAQALAGYTVLMMLVQLRLLLDFTNISHAACTLYGYPGVSFSGGAAHASQIGAAATENAAASRQLVTLAPGAVAGAELRIVDAGNFPAASCNTVTAHYLRVFPPNQLAPLYLALTTPTCVNSTQILTVSAVRPGAGDAS